MRVYKNKHNFVNSMQFICKCRIRFIYGKFINDNVRAFSVYDSLFSLVLPMNPNYTQIHLMYY